MANNLSRMDAVAEARAWLGTPFHHQASVKCVGCDCIGLIKGVGVTLRLVDYDPASPEAQAFANYSMLPNSRRMREGWQHGWFLSPLPTQRWPTFSLWLGGASRSMSPWLRTKASSTAIQASAKWLNMRWMKAGNGGLLLLIVTHISAKANKWPFLL